MNKIKIRKIQCKLLAHIKKIIINFNIYFGKVKVKRKKKYQI